MSRTKIGFQLLLLVLLCAGCSAPAGDPQLLSMQELAHRAAQEDGVVYTYGMADNYGGYQGLFQLIDEEHGIRHVDIDMSSSAVMRHLDEERGMATTDLGSTGYLYGPAAQEQGLLDCVPSAAAPHLPPWASGPGDGDCRGWFAMFSGTLGFMVNTDIIEDPPRSWEDLLREEFAGKITFNDPRASATGVSTLLAAALARGGSAEDPAAGVELLVQLARNGGVENVLSRQDYAGFVRGTQPIQINYDYTLLQLRDTQGINCTFIYPAEGTVRTPYSALLPKTRPHPFTSRLTMEFLLGPQGQARLAEGYVTPILPGVPLAPDIVKMVEESGNPKVYDVDWLKVGATVEPMKQAFDEAIKPLEKSAP